MQANLLQQRRARHSAEGQEDVLAGLAAQLTAAQQERDALQQQCSRLQAATHATSALQQQLVDQTAVNAALNRDKAALAAKLEATRLDALLGAAHHRAHGEGGAAAAAPAAAGAALPLGGGIPASSSAG